MRRDPPLVKVLTRQPGTKESRYMHLFAGDEAPTSLSDPEADSSTPSLVRNSADAARVAQLEVEVDALRRELETLREQFANFQKQFQ